MMKFIISGKVDRQELTEWLNTLHRTKRGKYPYLYCEGGTCIRFKSFTDAVAFKLKYEIL